MLGIEAKARLKSIPAVREVILGLRDIGQEDLVSIFQRDMVVLVAFHRLSRTVHDLLRSLVISGLQRARVRHGHMRPALHVMCVHRRRGYIHLLRSCCCRLRGVVLRKSLRLFRMMVLLAHCHRRQYQSQHCGCN